jgi:hypothetical protein
LVDVQIAVPEVGDTVDRPDGGQVGNADAVQHIGDVRVGDATAGKINVAV